MRGTAGRNCCVGFQTVLLAHGEIGTDRGQREGKEIAIQHAVIAQSLGREVPDAKRVEQSLAGRGCAWPGCELKGGSTGMGGPRRPGAPRRLREMGEAGDAGRWRQNA